MMRSTVTPGPWKVCRIVPLISEVDVAGLPVPRVADSDSLAMSETVSDEITFGSTDDGFMLRILVWWPFARWEKRGKNDGPAADGSMKPPQSAASSLSLSRSMLLRSPPDNSDIASPSIARNNGDSGAPADDENRCGACIADDEGRIADRWPKNIGCGPSNIGDTSLAAEPLNMNIGPVDSDKCVGRNLRAPPPSYLFDRVLAPTCCSMRATSNTSTSSSLPLVVGDVLFTLVEASVFISVVAIVALDIDAVALLAVAISLVRFVVLAAVACSMVLFLVAAAAPPVSPVPS